MGVVFFPSLPFMGVMLFPSFVLGNVSGEGGTFLVLPLFSILLSLPLPSSLSPSPSFSLPSFLLFFHILFSPFLFLLFFHILFSPFYFFFSSTSVSLSSAQTLSIPFSSSSLFHLFPFLLLFFFNFFFRELLVLCASKM